MNKGQTANPNIAWIDHGRYKTVQKYGTTSFEMPVECSIQDTGMTDRNTRQQSRKPEQIPVLSSISIKDTELE